MKYIKFIVPVFAVLLIAASLLGCGAASSSGSDTDTTAPTVLSTIPTPDATNVVRNGSITATFSESMTTSTITNDTFTLTASGDATHRITCEVVEFSGSGSTFTATLTPVATLAAYTSYEAIVSTEVEDLSGNHLVTAEVWRFTTGNNLDVTAPTVEATSPTSGETGVAIGSNITVTFSEPMKLSTITTGTFILSVEGGANKTCTVTRVGNIATLEPTSDLAYSTTYEARLTTAIKDLASNSMVAYTWKFMTAASPEAPSTGAVDFGMAGSYEVLASNIVKVDASPVTIEGNVGLSPLGTFTNITLTPVISTATTYSTSEQVSGRVYSSSHLAPTPDKLVAAIASVDAANVIINAMPVTSAEVGGASADIGGMVLSPGVYTWSGNVTMSSAITLTGSANDVWIFRIAGNFSPSAYAVNMGSFATAKNVVWQVGGFAAITAGAAAHVEGTIISAGYIALGDGASVNGRLFAKSYVQFDKNHVTQP